MSKTLTIMEANARSLADLLREVHRSQEPVRILMEDGNELEIKPAGKLMPLLTYEGYVPSGWKDAIYEPKRGG